MPAEPERPDRPPMEVLGDDRPPGALERWLGAVLRHRATRAVALVAGVGVVVGYLLTGGEESPPVEAQQPGPAQAVGPPDRRADIAPWQVTGDLAVEFVADGRVVTFTARNGGTTPRDPAELFVHVGYVGGGASAYVFPCEGADRQERRGGLVPPGGEVGVACADTLQLNGKPSRLPPEVLTVVTDQG